MAFAEDLLTQAAHLANLDRGKPRQANLRRSISASYYAVFHLLVADASDRVSPRSPASLSERIARSLAHSEMKQVCRAISEQHASPVLAELLPQGFSPELRLVASEFIVLQVRRNAADYDLSKMYSRVDTLDILRRAQEVFSVWKKTRNSDEANVFLAALSFGSRWDK